MLSEILQATGFLSAREILTTALVDYHRRVMNGARSGPKVKMSPEEKAVRDVERKDLMRKAREDRETNEAKRLAALIEGEIIINEQGRPHVHYYNYELWPGNKVIKTRQIDPLLYINSLTVENQYKPSRSAVEEAIANGASIQEPMI